MLCSSFHGLRCYCFTNLLQLTNCLNFCMGIALTVFDAGFAVKPQTIFRWIPPRHRLWRRWLVWVPWRRRAPLLTAAEVTYIPLVVAAAAERCVLIASPFFVRHPVFGETVITKSTGPQAAIGARAGEHLCMAMGEDLHDGQVTGRQMGCSSISLQVVGLSRNAATATTVPR